MLKHVFPYDARAFSFNFLKSNSRCSFLCNCLKNARAVLLSHVRSLSLSLLYTAVHECESACVESRAFNNKNSSPPRRIRSTFAVCVRVDFLCTYICIWMVHNHYTLMQGSKTVPPTYKRRGRDRARWRTGSAKCVRQHKEKN